MASDSKIRKNILFVDDSVEYLEIFSQTMGMWSKGDWNILTAPNAARAMEILAAEPVNLVVIDLQMPVIDGLQLLRLIHRTRTNLLKAILTGHLTQESRESCLNAGADLFLQKPTSVEGMESVFSALNELIKVEAEEGFQGTLRRVGLHDILQLECLGRNSTILEIFNKDNRGEIFIENGAITHAQTKDLSGEDALFKLLSISGGGFKAKPFVPPPVTSISQSWEYLLMESSRMRDEVKEGAATAEQEAPYESNATPTTEEPAPRLPKVKLPKEKKEPVQITETVVFSSSGEVLYEWRSADVELRKRFLEFISEKASRLSQSLSLGTFDLVEIHRPQSRIVAQIQPEAGIYLEAEKTSPVSAGAA